MLLNATGPGTLVVSEIYYPGWRVYINEIEQDLSLSYSILRSVELPEGDYQVLFKFVPNSVYIGLSLSLLGWIALGYLYFRNKID